MAQRSRSRAGGDDGFSLVEVVITMLLIVLISGVVGGLILGAIRGQRDIGEATSATTAGQLVAVSVAHGIRNANAIGFGPSPAGTQLLVARTVEADATAEWVCRSWYYDGDAVYTAASASAAPSADETAASLRLADGVMEAGGPVFALPDTPTVDGFSLEDRSVAVRFEMANGDGAPVLIDTVAVSRQVMPTTGPGGAGVAPCF